MCFSHGDSIPIVRQEYRCARKQHWCDECGGIIIAGDQYKYAVGVSYNDFATWKICEECIYIAACITAIETTHGCTGWTARPPIGDGSLRENLFEYDLHVADDDYASDQYNDDPSNGIGYVVRWPAIDALKSGEVGHDPYLIALHRRVLDSELHA